MAKYIIDLPENTHWIQWILESAEDHHPYMDYKTMEDLTPYTEPDLERVKKTAHDDGYSAGYQAGREDLNRVMSDVEQVKEEAFKNGYDAACKDIDIKSKINAAYRKGLEDVWYAVGKISNMYSEERRKIFGENFIQKIFVIYSASEVIEKIRQYEQEQEGFHVGDEFENETGKKFVVLKVNGKEIDRYIDSDGQTYHMNVRYRVMRKTGRHFPEITTFFEKMREGQEQ